MLLPIWPGECDGKEKKKKWEANANVRFIPKGSAPDVEDILDKIDHNIDQDDDHLDDVSFNKTGGDGKLSVNKHGIAESAIKITMFWWLLIM